MPAVREGKAGGGEEGALFLDRRFPERFANIALMMHVIRTAGPCLASWRVASTHGACPHARAHVSTSMNYLL